MCNNCNKNNCNCINSQLPINCNPCTKVNYCIEKMDSDCVYYNLNQPDLPSKLTCTGIPSNTSLTLILEEFDKRLCGFIGNFGIQGDTTDSISTTVTSVGNIYTVSSDLILDPNSTAPVSITALGLRVDCCEEFDCSTNTRVLNTTLGTLTKATSFFATLQPYYFTKSDYILTFNFNDTSSVSGGEPISFLKYTLTQPAAIGSFYTTGGIKTLNVNTCAKSFIGTTGTLLTEILTKHGCYTAKNCAVSTEKINYSERFSRPYRANFQINDLPIVEDPESSPNSDKGILYFADTVPFSISTSNGGAIRKINLNTNETISLLGESSQGIGAITLNNVLGSVVKYDYPSSICVDKNTISNDEPVLYFAAFGETGVRGGCVCRAVKEFSNSCDERDNWVNYIIAGDGVSLGDLPTGGSTVNGSAARFTQIYGLKKWYNINGEPSFYIVDIYNQRIKFLYYKGSSDINDSSNWRVKTLTLDGTNPYVLAGNAANINIEDDDLNPAYKNIIALHPDKIELLKWTGASPTIAQCTDLSSVGWATETVVNNPIGNIDGNTSVARVYNPSHIYKFTDFSSSDTYYIFGQEDVLMSANTSTIRKIYKISSGNYTFSTIVPTGSVIPSVNESLIGTTGIFSAINGYSQGFFYDLQNNLCDFTCGGIRIWDYDNAITSLKVGGSSNISTQTEYASLPQPIRMDTQYELKLTC